MLIPQKIVLVGPMGAGKSTIGRLLAKHLNFPFEDTDYVIEQRCGANIAWIFDVEGEVGFRQRETAVLKELLQQRNLILATGGGIVIQEDNRQCLIQNADVVIYLQTDVAQLVKRTAKDNKRPLLQVDNPEKKIRELLEHRECLYRQVATHIVDTDAQNPKLVIKKIMQQILS